MAEIQETLTPLPPVLQRSRLINPSRTASRPQLADAPALASGPGPEPSRPASARPTSRPSTYPAEKLITVTTAMTPALTTQVMSVGASADTESDMPARRVFFDADICEDSRSLDDDARRLDFDAARDSSVLADLLCRE